MRPLRQRFVARCSPRLLIDVLWCALGAVIVAALVAPPDVTGDRLGLRRFLTPPVSAEWRVAQRFRMNVPHLTAVEFRPAAVGPVTGTFRLTIRDRDARGVERSADVRAEDLVRDSSYVFRFEPILDSEDHEYQLEIAPAPHDPGTGLALWATKGGRAEGSALRINNAPRWGSLAYQAHTPSVSHLRALLLPSGPGRPPRWLGLAAVIGIWLSIRLVLRALADAAEDAAARSTAAPA